MIDVTTEHLIRLDEATLLVGKGRNGRPVHVTTILRWISTGQRAPGGNIVHLEGIRIGGSWRTSREALQRFAEQLTPRVESDPQPSSQTSAKRRRASER